MPVIIPRRDAPEATVHIKDPGLSGSKGTRNSISFMLLLPLSQWRRWQWLCCWYGVRLREYRFLRDYFIIIISLILL
jgi:hypothetical protein